MKEKFGQNTHEMDTAYFPLDRTISSTMYNCMMKLRNSKFNSENVLEMVKLWKQNNLNDLIYFRPKTSEDDTDFLQYSGPESDDDILYEVPPLWNKREGFVIVYTHHSSAKDLVKHYNNLVLMDTTYHTCRLMLLTFFWL